MTPLDRRLELLVGYLLGWRRTGHLPAAAVALGRRVDAREWDALFEHAARHGVDWLVLPGADALAAAGVDVPVDARRTATARQLATRARIRREAVEPLVELLAGLHRAGVRACPLKGPVLAARTTGDALARRVGDLDLLVHPDDHGIAGDCLTTLGWQLHPDPLADEFVYRRDGAVPLEVHRVPQTAFGVTWNVPAMMERTWRATGPVAATFGDVTLLDPVDELLVLAVHGARHQFERLQWLVDLALAPLGREQTERIPLRARGLGASSVLRYTACELAGRTGVHAPWTSGHCAGWRIAGALALARAIRGGSENTLVRAVMRRAFQLVLARVPDGVARAGFDGFRHLLWRLRGWPDYRRLAADAPPG